MLFTVSVHMYWVHDVAVEAFHVGVFGRFARPDMQHIDLPFDLPGQEVATAQFGAIITANRLRLTESLDSSAQHVCHTPAGETGVNIKSMPAGEHPSSDLQCPVR